MSNLDLKRFVLRSEVLKLYRTFLRASRGAPNPQIKGTLLSLSLSLSLSLHMEATWEPQHPTAPMTNFSLFLHHHPHSSILFFFPLPDELGKQVRQEFETQKHLDDGYSIKYALSDGRAKLKQLEAMFGMTS